MEHRVSTAALSADEESTGEHLERRITVPMPPETDSQGNPTANYGYEFKLALWRERVTDLVYDTREEVKKYREDEERRHQETMSAIEGRSQALKAFWEWLRDSSVACVHGTAEVMKAAMDNSNGQLKWIALILIGLAGILNGVAVSGLGFTIGDEEKAPAAEAAGAESFSSPSGPQPAP
jgi:hypothetical protein